MELRPFDPDRDVDGFINLLDEVGWADPKSDVDRDALRNLFPHCRHIWFATVDGQIAAYASSTKMLLRHGDVDIPARYVCGVATSRAARNQGYASRVTAKIVAEAALEGAALMTINAFELGYYDRLGFGLRPYSHSIIFDPADLVVKTPARAAVRLGADDYKDMHAARMSAMRRHGEAVCPDELDALMPFRWRHGCNAWGYRNSNGSLTHYFRATNSSSQAMGISALVYRNPEQFVELLGLMKSMSDQYRTISMNEPAGFQMVEFLRSPLRSFDFGREGSHPTGLNVDPSAQARILDPALCLAATRVACDEMRFNLRLSDPIERHVDGEWRGCGGEYVVTLGKQSRAERASESGLPTLTATVNAFTRLWLGVLPATSLAVSGGLSGPEALLTRLDGAITLPKC